MAAFNFAIGFVSFCSVVSRPGLGSVGSWVRLGCCLVIWFLVLVLGSWSWFLVLVLVLGLGLGSCLGLGSWSWFFFLFFSLSCLLL